MTTDHFHIIDRHAAVFSMAIYDKVGIVHDWASALDGDFGGDG